MTKTDIVADFSQFGQIPRRLIDFDAYSGGARSAGILSSFPALTGTDLLIHSFG